jgi:Fe-S oxidoreductase
MNPIAMTVILVGTLSIFAWSAYRRFQLIRVAKPEPEFDLSRPGELEERIKQLVLISFGQKKMPANEKYRLAGLAHAFIFGAFLVLGLNSVMLWVRGYDAHFDLFGILGRGTLLGDGYSITKEFFAAMAVLGSVVFMYYRVVTREKRMTLGVEGMIILGIISTMMLADFLYNGAAMVLDARNAGEALHFHAAEPVASTLALLLKDSSDGLLRVLSHAGFWWHSAFVLIFLNLLPYSKHFHVITNFPNVFASRVGPVGRLPMVEDLEGKVEREEPVGTAKITDLSWKQVLDLYTCTECGRCSDNCPAYTTGKKLSPKHLTLALRDHLYASEGRLITDLGVTNPTAKAEKKGEEGEEAAKEVLHTNPPAPEGGYFTTGADVDLVPNIIDPDVIWACTSCRACEEQCPVMITYVDKIVQMRRDQVMIKNEFPPDLQKPFRGIETNGNPWNLSAMDRANWAEGLGIPTLEEKPDAKVLYWVGCAASYDDRAKKVSRSVAKLLQHAKVDFAILGTEETCTGDPARRAGNEFLFQMMAQQNVEVLNNYKTDKKTVITACPHCFNTLKNEYPDFGGHYEVVHHTDFLNQLIKDGKLIPDKKVSGSVAYHDSCYLGRYNNVYDSPRQILQSIPGLELREVSYWTKSKGLCCGAGGAQMFMEEQHGTERVNKKRTLQLLDTGAQTLATACPFCMTMITDGLKAEEKEDKIGQRDVAEILASAVGVDADVADAQAAEE